MWLKEISCFYKKLDLKILKNGYFSSNQNWNTQYINPTKKGSCNWQCIGPFIVDGLNSMNRIHNLNSVKEGQWCLTRLCRCKTWRTIVQHCCWSCELCWCFAVDRWCCSCHFFVEKWVAQEKEISWSIYEEMN